MTAIGLALLLLFGTANYRAVQRGASRWWIRWTERGCRLGLAVTVCGLLLTVWRYFA